MEIEKQEQETDSLAMFREQVKNEVRPTMSESAAQKLRAINEADRLDKIDNGRFCTALKSVIVTPDNLRKLIERIQCTGFIDPESGEYIKHGFLDDKGNFQPLKVEVSDLERRVNKLMWWIMAGFELGREIDSVHLINFFSELTQDEMYMTDSQFNDQWRVKNAERVKASRISRGIIKPVESEPVYRPCKSGKKCMRFEKRKPAPAAGKGEYCSPACSASARARQKRALAAAPSGMIQ